jgi:hypothetical protein
MMRRHTAARIAGHGSDVLACVVIVAFVVWLVSSSMVMP